MCLNRWFFSLVGRRSFPRSVAACSPGLGQHVALHTPAHSCVRTLHFMRPFHSHGPISSSRANPIFHRSSNSASRFFSAKRKVAPKKTKPRAKAEPKNVISQGTRVFVALSFAGVGGALIYYMYEMFFAGYVFLIMFLCDDVCVSNSHWPWISR